MANNTITLLFALCVPAPVGGYKVTYRPVGGFAYRVWPVNFMTSPAVFTDTNDPEGTSYEGYIQGDCGDGKLGVPVTFTATNQEGSGSGGGSGSGSSESSFNVEVQTAYDNAGNETTIVSPLFFTITEGAFPIPGGGTSVRGNHSGFSGVISVAVKLGGALSGTLRLFVTGELTQCISVPSDGTYAFASVTIDPGDDVFIMFFDDVC